MLKKLFAATAIAGIAIAGAPSVAHAAPGADSITACVLTNGVLTNSTFPLTIEEGAEPRLDTVSMVPTPATGKYLYSEYGFVNKTTGEFIETSSGTGAADNAGYQPPADPGWYALTQRFANYPQYPASDWTFEYRWWAVQGTVGSLTPDKPGEPLCKITVIVPTADGGGSTGSEDLANTGGTAEGYSVANGVAVVTLFILGGLLINRRRRSQ